jgi:hypothetical protein
LADPLYFCRIIQGELPFSLNLPEGTYPVDVDRTKYELHLLQNRLAVPIDALSMRMGKPADLKAELGDR